MYCQEVQAGKCWQSDRKRPILAEAVTLSIWYREKGLYGFDGIRRTAELMMDAYLNEKDTEKLVVQKGWGVRVLSMRQSYRMIPVYTADVSGVCSAL